MSANASPVLEILVVDDEVALRDMLERSFTREGHRVTSVPDGASAIQRAGSDHFDVILLDVALGPGPNGYEVCRTLRARRNVVPIIMLTALDSEADAVQGLEADSPSSAAGSGPSSVEPAPEVSAASAVRCSRSPASPWIGRSGRSACTVSRRS